MQNNAIAKTVWARRNSIPLAVMLIAIMALLLAVYVFSQPAVTLHAGDRVYELELADTLEEQELGLGKRDSLPLDRGMLFAYDTPEKHCFWMKDTHFALDMIWLDAQKRVVHIEQDVSPDTYPDTFCPSAPAQYIIELNAGQATAAGIRINDTLSF